MAWAKSDVSKIGAWQYRTLTYAQVRSAWPPVSESSQRSPVQTQGRRVIRIFSELVGVDDLLHHSTFRDALQRLVWDSLGSQGIVADELRHPALKVEQTATVVELNGLPEEILLERI